MSQDKLQQQLIATKQKLDEISPSFCAAKWKQVTIHLQNGHTHSCHHPTTHKIPVEELRVNPSALHNTSYKKLQRKDMLEGIRPAECDYCWKVEDTSNSHSDRICKSSDTWAAPHIADIVKQPWDHNVTPSYVEVSFSNVCNFKCSYCSPTVSSQWMEEIERYGAYPTSNQFNNLRWIKHHDQLPIPKNQKNPYVDAFWNWWPTIHKEVKHFRITGGEPLLNKNTFKLLDYLIENPAPGLDFSINSNMCPPPALLDAFIEKIKIIVFEKKVKQFKIFTSAEAHGKQSEYIRFGMNYALWLANIERVLQEVPGVSFTIMSTYNALSVTTYSKFLEDVVRLKKQYYKPKFHFTPVMLDIPYLRYPSHQSIFILTEEFLKMIHAHVTFMYANLESPDRPYDGFFEFEADKLQRIYEMAQTGVKNPASDVTTHRIDFVKFVDEHDVRRKTNFLETFPEMTTFYNHCGAQ
jgi:hypothetical protein